MVSCFKDYLSCRPTEYSEEGILLCESRYIESEKQMKKFKGLKRFSYSSKVVEDETYYFRFGKSKGASPLIKTESDQHFCFGVVCRKLIVPQKEASPFLDKKIDELEIKLADMEDADDDMEDMDDDDDAPVTPSMPQMQNSLSSDMDIMPYTPSQVFIYVH